MRPQSINWQRALYIPLTILAWLAVIVVVGWLLHYVLTAVLMLVLSGIVAFALTPLVARLSRWIPRMAAILVAYVLGFAIVFGLGALLVVTAAAQVSTLVHDAPSYLNELHRLEPEAVRLLRPFGVTDATFADAHARIVTDLQRFGRQAASQSLNLITDVISALIDIVLVLILSVYLTANGPRIGAWVRREAPRGQHHRAALLVHIVNQVVGGYIRGQFLLALLIGVLVGAGMLILQVPYAVLLGVLAFFMEFIPVIGVFISGAVSVLVALLTGWVRALFVLGYFVFVHVIEGEVVGPRIMGHAVGIHPATALVALVAGTELFGIWGALLAAPVAGLLQAIAAAAWDEIKHGQPEELVAAAVDEVEEEAKQPARD